MGKLLSKKRGIRFHREALCVCVIIIPKGIFDMHRYICYAKNNV